MKPTDSLPCSQEPTNVNHIYLVNILPAYFPKTQSNTIFPTTPTPSGWSLPFRFLTKILYAFHIFLMCATCPIHLIFLDLIFDHPHNIWWSKQVTKLPIMQSFIALTTSSLLSQNIFSQYLTEVLLYIKNIKTISICLVLILQPGNHCNLACFLWSNIFKHSSSNHGLCCFNS